MSQFIIQVYTVGLLIIPTVLLVWKFGCTDSPLCVPNRRHNQTVTVDSVDDVQDHYQFKIVRSYDIGSWLRADVMEWPKAFQFHNEIIGGRPALCTEPTCKMHKPSSLRRQHLYAWLQLSETEKHSMDKWDLFPHRRSNNQAWLEQYEARKDSIEGLVRRCNITLPWDQDLRVTCRIRNMLLQAKSHHSDHIHHLHRPKTARIMRKIQDPRSHAQDWLWKIVCLPQPLERRSGTEQTARCLH